MKKVLFGLLIGIIVFTLLACKPESNKSQDAKENHEASPFPEETSAPIIPTSTQEQAEAKEILLPDGVISIGEKTTLIRLTRINGELIDEWAFPGFRNSPIIPTRTNRFHFGGSTDVGLISSPCIFNSTYFGDKRIIYHAGKSSLITLQQVDEIIQLVGAPGKPLVVFSSLDPENVRYFDRNRYQPTPEVDGEPTQEPAVINSWLYSASLFVEPISRVLMTRSDENGYSIFPVSINMKDDDLIGVWYSLQFEGSYGGGPIIFSDHKGLYYFDLESGLDQEIFNQDINLMALSNDQRIAAYESPGDSGNTHMMIHNLATGDIKPIEALAGYVTFGPGDAKFSISGKYLAWRDVILGEESLSSIIRIASMAEDEIIEFNGQDILLETTDPEAYGISLAGWLDDRQLMIEVHSFSGPALYILDIDEKSLTYFAPGYFVGFTYP